VVIGYPDLNHLAGHMATIKDKVRAGFSGHQI
jgi:hypothetical protein